MILYFFIEIAAFLCPIGSGGIHLSWKRLTSLFQSTNQKYEKTKVIFMKWTIVLLTTSVLLLCVFFAGCTSPSERGSSPLKPLLCQYHPR